MTQAEMIQEFIDKVQNLHEIEYGDFKRKVGLYIARLEEDLVDPSLEARQILERMRIKCVYDPIPDIELVRVEMVELAERLTGQAKPGDIMRQSGPQAARSTSGSATGSGPNPSLNGDSKPNLSAVKDGDSGSKDDESRSDDEYQEEEVYS